MLWPVTQPYFVKLTPFSLILTLILLGLHHPEKYSWRVGTWAVFVAITGFSSEVLGVHGGWLFGQYSYPHSLGTQLFGVPLILGVNWLLLIYVTRDIVQPLAANAPTKAALAATLMVGLDTFIEPVAIRNKFWEWPQNIVASQNYVGWWLVAFFILLASEFWQVKQENPLSKPVYWALFYFFMAQVLAYSLGF